MLVLRETNCCRQFDVRLIHGRGRGSLGESVRAMGQRSGDGGDLSILYVIVDQSDIYLLHSSISSYHTECLFKMTQLHD